MVLPLLMGSFRRVIRRQNNVTSDQKSEEAWQDVSGEENLSQTERFIQSRLSGSWGKVTVRKNRIHKHLPTCRAEPARYQTHERAGAVLRTRWFYYDNSHLKSKKSLGVLQKNQHYDESLAALACDDQSYIIIAKGHFQLKSSANRNINCDYIKDVRTVADTCRYANTCRKIKECDPRQKGKCTNESEWKF